MKPGHARELILQYRSARLWGLIAGLVIFYFVAAKLGLELARVHPSVTAVWPPSGIALAALLLGGSRLWPGVFLGAFLANVTTQTSIAASLGIAAGNTLEGVAGAYLVNRFCGGVNAFERPADVFRFTLAALLSTALGATFGAASLTLGGYAELWDFGAIWLHWWIGDAAGDLIVGPLLLLWGINPAIRWKRGKIAEGVFLLLYLIIATLFIFGGWQVGGLNRLPFVFIPLLVWAAFRFGQRETAAAAFLIAGICIWGTLSGRGPFLLASQQESFLLISSFISTLGITGLALAAGISELRRVESSLRSSLRQQAEVAALGLRALAAPDLPSVMKEAVSLIARTLEVEYASVLKLLPDRRLLLEAGAGWAESCVGRETVGTGADSQAGYTLLSGSPVIADDLRYETRFRIPAIYREHKAISAMSVIVHGENGPYGVLEAHSGRRRTFGPDDVHFLQAVANALSSAVGREERAAELRRYSAELETFSYTVAQELRSPLWSIRGLTQTLSKDFASRMELKRLESVQRIAGDAERMDRMIQGLLAYGRFSRVDLKPERWSLAALIPEALNRLGEEIRRSGARVDVADPLPEVLADRTALVEILVHLLSNGIKFVKPGTAPRLRLWTVEADGFVRLYVEDDGTGIAPEHQERIFKIFERLQPSDGRPGSGIGLAIVARGVAWMGGRRGVESEIGKGSRFWIELPKAPP